MTADSLTLAAAPVLFAAGIVAWIVSAPLRAASRLYLRFAAVLLAGLAVASAVHLGDMAGLFLLPLSAGALTLAAGARFARQLPDLAATVLLVVMMGCGLCAALCDWPMLAVAPVLLAGLAIIAVALGDLALVPAAGGAALLAAALAFLQQGAAVGALLFCAAALTGLARPEKSAPAIDQRAGTQARRAIGGLR